MHRLRTRKGKAKDDGATKDDSSTSNGVFSGKAFKRNKSQPPPVTRQPIDLAAALPSQDDFRISLMMPNLEQRFSVLRDEIEKQQAGPGVHGMGYGALASGTLSLDDQISGGFTRPPYGKGSLQDIAETASIASSRYGAERKNSQSDDSVMTRPRPGEGNVLFGGRQKVYRVNTASESAKEDASENSPLASPTGSGSGSGRNMGGRAFFSDDLPGGSFVSDRQREKDKREREKEEKDQQQQQQRSRSPVLSNYNNDRNTTSSNGSGPTSLTRSSTAATSIGSHSNVQASGAMVSKPRRAIYEQALDRDLHDNYASQKLDIISQRRFGSTSPAFGVREDDEENTSRPASPPTKKFARPLSPDAGRDEESRGRSGSPVQAGNLSTRNAAMKSFQGRGLPQFSAPMKPNPPSKDSTTSNLATFDFGIKESGARDITNSPTTMRSGLPTPREGSSEFEPVIAQKIAPAHSEPSPLPSPLPDLKEQYHDDARSNRSYNSRGSSNEYNAAPQSRTSSKTTTSQPDSVRSGTSNEARDTSLVESNNNPSTFFDNVSEGDDKSDYGSVPTSRHVSEQAPYTNCLYNQHTQKFRQVSNLDTSVSNRDTTTSSRPSVADNSSPTSVYPPTEPNWDIDSPTLPDAGGLSNMVREHFRQDSNASSVYPMSIHPDRKSNANAYEDWDNEDIASQEYQRMMDEPKARLTLAELKKKEAMERQQRETALASLAGKQPSADNDLRPRSNESNDDWQNELAQRRKAVQQKMQEHSGRNSPMPSNNSDTRLPLVETKNPSPVQINDQILGMLRSKASTGMVEAGNGGRDDSKAMKLLGLANEDGRDDGPPLSPTSGSHGKIRARFRPPPKNGGPNGEGRPRPPPSGRAGPPPMGQMQPGQPRQGPHNFPPGPGMNQGPPRQDRGPPMHRDPQIMQNGRGMNMRPPHERPQQDGPPYDRPLHDRRPYQGKPMANGPPADLRPPHDRSMGPGPSVQQSGFQGPMNQQRLPPQGRRRSPSVAQSTGSSPQRSSPPRYPPTTQLLNKDRTRSNEEFNGPAPQLRTRRSDKDFQQTRSRKQSDAYERPPMSTVNSDPVPSRRREMEKEQPIANTSSRGASADGEATKQLKKAPQETLQPMENVVSRFSSEDPPALTTFAGRLRSNSKAMKTLGTNPTESSNQLLSPIQTNVPQFPSSLTPTSATSGFYSNTSANNSTVGSFPHSPVSATITNTITGNSQTLADLHNPVGSNAVFQNLGTGQREIRKVKVKKSDIGLPKLEHTTSTMPSSILIQAGPNSIGPPPLILQNGAIQARQNAAVGKNSSSLPFSNSTPDIGPGPAVSQLHKLKKSPSEGYGLHGKLNGRPPISPLVLTHPVETMPGMI